MENTHSYVTEGIILAAIPAAGYWAAYLYELGYCHFFGIPPHLIDISIGLILLNSLAVISGCIFAILAIDFIRKTMIKVTPAVKYSLYKVIFIYFIGYGFYLAFDRSETELRVFLTVFIVPIFLKDFVWPLWSQRHIEGFGNKVAAAKKVDFEFDSATDHLARRFGAGLLTTAGIFYLVSILSYLAGGYGAKTETEFLASKEKPNYILARKYGDSWVAVKFDEAKKIFYSEFLLLKLENANDFSRHKYGPLRPQDD